MSDHPTLKSQLGAEPPRSQIISECETLVDDEVRAKSGMSGAAIKLGYKTVKAIKPGFVRGALDGLLDDWLEELEPFHVEWRQAGGSFGAFIAGRKDAVAEAMLSVTDRRAEVSDMKTAKKMYFKMRPTAKDNVVAAVPKLAALLEKHLK